MIRKKFLPLILILFLAACAEEDDNTPGTSPPQDPRNRFEGSWLCTESGSPTPFTITITLHGSEDSLYIDNFGNYGSTADALALASGNSLTIPGQNISVTSIFVQGSGVLNSQGNQITMNYIADSDTISATCTKN